MYSIPCNSQFLISYDFFIHTCAICADCCPVGVCQRQQRSWLLHVVLSHRADRTRSDHEVITKIMKCTYCTWTLLDAGSVKVCLSKSVCAPLCWEKGQKQSWSHSRWLRRHALSTFWWLKSEGPMYQWTNGPTKLIMNIFEHSYEHSYEVMDST